MYLLVSSSLKKVILLATLAIAHPLLAATETDVAQARTQLEEAFEGAKYQQVKLGKWEKRIYTSMKIATISVIVGLATYMAAKNMTFTGENMLLAIDQIKSSPEEAKEFLYRSGPAGTFGIESGLLIMYYRQFMEFLTKPKVFYFALKKHMEKKGYSTKSRRGKTALFAAKETESFVRGASFQLAFYSPIFAAKLMDGSAQFEGLGPFLHDVFLATAALTTLQFMAEVGIGNFNDIKKGKAKSISEAKWSERKAVYASSALSIVTNYLIATQSLAEAAGSESYAKPMRVFLLGTAGSVYLVYLAHSLKNIKNGKDMIHYNEKTGICRGLFHP